MSSKDAPKPGTVKVSDVSREPIADKVYDAVQERLARENRR